MKKILKLVGLLAGLGVLAVILMILLMPWMDRWGATQEEVAASFPGDELVPSPHVIYNRAVTVHAAPAEIYPWIVQLGAERGGMYSYSWFETHILQCELINADRIHSEWQNLQVGDKVKMCPGEEWGPPPYEVAWMESNQVIVMGHQENGVWGDVWQFNLVPQTDGTTRLILRSRDTKSGGFWDAMRPGEFIMSRGMLLGIKERAEGLAKNGGFPAIPEITPTPEIFNPLNPSPTPSNSTLPLSCQLTDLNISLDTAGRYCFAYPKRFAFGREPSFNLPAVMGPDIGSAAEPVHALFAVEVTPYHADQSLDQQVDEFLRNFTVATPASLTRARLTVGGESAVQVDPVPVQLSWRIVFVPHGDQLYRLMYWPVDVPEAKADLEELYQTTLNSFVFLPQGTQFHTLFWSAFGKNISVSYEPSLAASMEITTVPAVLPDNQSLFSNWHPAYAQFHFLGFPAETDYQLPFIDPENNLPRIMIFQTKDFPGFGDEHPQGFVNQLQSLTKILKAGVKPDQCDKPVPDYETALPFLPWVNMKQSFCAQPQLIEFTGGKGLRYVTYYAQSPEPVLEQRVFYTFQGLTEDGALYISAVFPIQTGIFPTEPSPCPKCGDPNYNPFPEWDALLTEQLSQLNAQPANDFAPALTSLDELIESIHIEAGQK